jgi:hypothetical protein
MNITDIKVNHRKTFMPIALALCIAAGVSGSIEMVNLLLAAGAQPWREDGMVLHVRTYYLVSNPDYLRNTWSS